VSCNTVPGAATDAAFFITVATDVMGPLLLDRAGAVAKFCTMDQYGLVESTVAVSDRDDVVVVRRRGTTAATGSVLLLLLPAMNTEDAPTALNTRTDVITALLRPWLLLLLLLLIIAGATAVASTFSTSAIRSVTFFCTPHSRQISAGHC